MYFCIVKQKQKITTKNKNLWKKKELTKNVRITFRAETTISGKTLEEIASKFEGIRIPNVTIIEVVHVMDDETYEDLNDHWNEVF